MGNNINFEEAWIRKLVAALDEVAGEQACQEVTRGSEGLSSNSEREDVIRWIRRAMGRLTGLVEEEQARDVMTRCACEY
ncbi:hypothetical protein DRJ24_05340, partial [Candidatus Acetothermia bacterium]